MANTTSLKFPNMFNVTQNTVTVLEDSQSVVNRGRLLILTEPTELYNNPDFGVGLKRHLWKYNTENERAILLDRIKDQMRKHDPYVVPEDISYADGLLFTGNGNDNYRLQPNEMNITVALSTTFSDSTELTISAEDQEV